MRNRLLVAIAAAALAAPASAMGAAAPRIVGGTTTTTTAWPSTAFLLGVRDTDGDGDLDPDFSCTGSVIAPTWVVTAAHCVFSPVSPGTLETGMAVVLGVGDYTDPARTIISAAQLIPDPAFSQSPAPHNDIALVRLAQPTIQPPIALPEPGVDYTTPANTPNAAGWGTTDEQNSVSTTALRQAFLPLQSDTDVCARLIFGYDAATMVCAGNPHSSGVCHGDSGGPLVVFDPVTAEPVLYGLTSYGTPDAFNPPLAPCSLSVPAAFTWVPAFLPFIQQHLGLPATATPTRIPIAGATAPTITPPVPPSTPITAPVGPPVTTPALPPAVTTPTKPVVAPPDRTRPLISRLVLSHTHFRAAHGGATLAALIGATLAYRLSEKAAVTVTVQRATTSSRHRTTWRSLTPVARLAGHLGSNRSLFSGRLAGRRLTQGTYRLSLQAVDAAGNHSPAVTVSFKIVA